ncbi:hypothetical protein BDW74DRAFT_180211 [Aspergillus multicolor]|uniref:uncharacterized protein n=1 Tax=Aspergillus multicolor TaxID=41759 RepID=UPI003CCD73CE
MPTVTLKNLPPETTPTGLETTFTRRGINILSIQGVGHAAAQTQTTLSPDEYAKLLFTVPSPGQARRFVRALDDIKIGGNRIEVQLVDDGAHAHAHADANTDTDTDVTRGGGYGGL